MSNKRKIVANDYRTGYLTEFVVEDGRFRSISVLERSQDSSTLWICPGFVDVQVNGFGGFDINTSQVDADTVVHMVDALENYGVTSCMPTIITASNERMSHSVEAIREACERYPAVEMSVLGIHVEGPYLSSELGFRGAHPAHEMRNPNWEEFAEWQRLSGNRIAKITLAPERDGAIEFIAKLRRHGVIVAMGHSNASAPVIHEAIQAGLSMCTHLGNGIHYLLNRHAPCLWVPLASNKLYAGMIADGHHLPPSVLKVIAEIKGSKAILVSDAVNLAGLAPGVYDAHVEARVVLEPNGRLHLESDPNVLAGSAMSLLDGVGYMLEQLYPGQFRKVIDMATVNPMKLMKPKRRDRGQLKEGMLADFLLFDFDTHNPFRLREVWRRGERVKDTKWSKADECIRNKADYLASS